MSGNGECCEGPDPGVQVGGNATTSAYSFGSRTEREMGCLLFLVMDYRCSDRLCERCCEFGELV